MEHLFSVLAGALVGSASGYVVAGIGKTIARFTVALEEIAFSGRYTRANSDLLCNALGEISAKLSPHARVAEIQLERMDRARPAIDPGHVDPLSLACLAPALQPREPVLPVSKPSESAPRDVPCPACGGKFPADVRCKLCFGSSVTSAQAAAFYENAGMPRGVESDQLKGSF